MTTPAPAESLRVLAADEDTAKLHHTAELLERLGHQVTACAETVAEACAIIAREDPDASIVVIHDDIEHALDLIEELTEVSSGPVIALLNDQDADVAKAASERGISALASAASADELQSALEVACRRHEETTRLSAQVDQLEHALERRAVIERAKGILMERHGLTERAAFEALRSHARRTSTQVVIIARQVADAGLDPLDPVC